MFKKYLQGRIDLNWQLGIALILIFGGLRFIAVLYGIQSGDNKYLSIVFCLMILAPFALLTQKGRRFIKFQKPATWWSIVLSLLLGALSCTVVYLLGHWLYGNGMANWFRYIGESYPVDLQAIPTRDKQAYFIVFSIIGMTFSPFGEELLYRGLVHGSFVRGWGERRAALVDSIAFGLTHLAHFGLVYDGATWSFYFFPALTWVVLMFLTGLVFNACKNISNSIVGAIVGHAGFNVTMTYWIFYPIF